MVTDGWPDTRYRKLGVLPAKLQQDRVSCPHFGEPMQVRTVVMPPAKMRLVKGLEQAAARAPPCEQSESVRDPLAVGA